ncbi:MAG: SRPBCC domain-containing protein [Acidobacteriia bacterium]|nr:SRPBCC domain-containing protein [Terriglobia bacterium]
MTRTTTTALAIMWLVAGACAQEQKIAEQPKLDVSKMHESLPDKDYTAKTTDTSFVAPNGERVQRLEIVIPNVTPRLVWEAVSTSEGLRSFVAPVTDVEMKTGGHYYTNYNPAAKIGDPGTIYNTVLAYVPLEMVAIHVKLGTQIFPESVATAERLNAILTIKDLGNGQVRVSEIMTGWQTGEDWDKVYKFFQTGNAYVLGQLYKRFEVGPRQWK